MVAIAAAAARASAKKEQRVGADLATLRECYTAAEVAAVLKRSGGSGPG